MERTSITGDGTNQLNWYTCIDSASTADFFDNVADERGTPRAANRSENEPLSRSIQLIVRQDPLATPSPTLAPVFVSSIVSLIASEDMHNASFTVENSSYYSSLTYTLSYDTDMASQGVVGTVALDNQETFSKENITLGSCSTGAEYVSTTLA